MAKGRKRQADGTSRVSNLIAIDASNVMARLRERMEEMVTLFSRLRDRSPLLDGDRQRLSDGHLRASWRCFRPIEQRAVNEFYELLGDLRWYMQYTEDMPLQLQKRVIGMVGRAARRTTGCSPP